MDPTNKPLVMILTLKQRLSKSNKGDSRLSTFNNKKAKYCPVPDYRQFHSTVPTSNTAQAGVTILMNHTLVDMASNIADLTPSHLKGFALHLVVDVPESALLHIIGVYYPGGVTSSRTQSWTHKIRLQLNKYIEQIAESNKQQIAHNTCHILVAGDFNAGAFSTGRAGQPQQLHGGHTHRLFVQGLKNTYGIQPTQTSQPRPSTFFRHDTSTNQRIAISRIDDVLTSVKQPSLDSLLTHTTNIIDTEHLIHTDHNGIRWNCPFQLLKMLPPPP